MTTELRVRTVVAPADIEAMTGKIVTESAYDVVLTGPCRLYGPTGKLLAVYLPGVLGAAMDDVYDVLHDLRTERTDNRGDASGTKRIVRGDQKRTRSSLVPSAQIGYADPAGMMRFCRLTSWTARNLPSWQRLNPLLREIDGHFAAAVPDRYAAQAAEIAKVDPAWVIDGTAFTTVTVNNTYPTGVHTDRGDFGPGFSTLAVCRRGLYTGGLFVLARYRVAVDMGHGDLLLLDAHEPHGNTQIVPYHVGFAAVPPKEEPERISLVSYMRAGMVSCGTADEEWAKAEAYAARRSGDSD
jgi:hypothetical protein